MWDLGFFFLQHFPRRSLVACTLGDSHPGRSRGSGQSAHRSPSSSAAAVGVSGAHGLGSRWVSRHGVIVRCHVGSTLSDSSPEQVWVWEDCLCNAVARSWSQSLERGAFCWAQGKKEQWGPEFPPAFAWCTTAEDFESGIGVHGCGEASAHLTGELGTADLGELSALVSFLVFVL